MPPSSKSSSATDSKPHESSQDSGPNASLKILSDLTSAILAADSHELLGDIRYSQLRSEAELEKNNMGFRKLFHIDLRNRDIYWEVCHQKMRVIEKFCLYSNKCKYSEAFKDKTIGRNNAIQILGKAKYNELHSESINSRKSLLTIHLNAINDYYADFQDFLQELTNLINEKLMTIYDGSYCQKRRSKHQNAETLEKNHLGLWEWFSFEITKIWKPLWENIKNQKIPQRHTQALFAQLEQLFKANSQYRCQGGLRQRPKFQEDRILYNYMRKTQYNEPQQKSFSMSQSIAQSSVQFHFKFQSEQVIEFSDNSTQIRCPYPENYSFADTIVNQSESDIENAQELRQSLKRPQNSCHQNCICLRNDGIQCPNLARKVQCQNHSCHNSQIREKRGVVCWYHDEKKNLSHYGNEGFSKVLETGQQLSEFHSFGFDMYTTYILLSLMPLNTVELEIEESNEDLKHRLIEKIIPYELSITENLFQAIVNVVDKSEYSKYKYEAKVLEKKLKWIRKLSLERKRGNTYAPQVQMLYGYYMGLGVRNIGNKIEKGKFIGKFVGEILPSWREEEKQIISTKHNQNPENQGNQIKFYCITAQSHYDDKTRPKCFSVDPQNIGNFCRSLNHSCDPNCKVEVMVSKGKYVLGVYTIKQVEENEQLTFDYDSVTDNYEEHIHSACLCGSLSCRGRYLKFQDEIYQGLDLKYLEEKCSMKKRIKVLITRCLNSNQNPEHKQQEMKKIIEVLQKPQIFYQCLPKQLDLWIYEWIRLLNSLVSKQLEYLSSSEQYKKQAQTKQNYAKIIKREKLCILNSKVEKIGHLYASINDFSPPFCKKSPQDLLEHLESVLNNKKSCLFSKVIKLTKNGLHSEQISQRLKKVRLSLVELAQKSYMNHDMEASHFYLRKAYQFSLIEPHIYPDYEGKAVNIWMEHSAKIHEPVIYYGEDLYILESLIAWPGEFKKIYKKSLEGSQKKINYDKTIDFNEKMENNFKKEHMLNLIQEVIDDFDQKTFSLVKERYAKQKIPLKTIIDFKRVKENLEKWILAQENSFKYPKLYENQSLQSSKSLERSQNSIKPLFQNSWESKVISNALEVAPTPLMTKKDQIKKPQAKSIYIDSNERGIENIIEEKIIPKKSGKVAKKGGKRNLNEFDQQKKPSLKNSQRRNDVIQDLNAIENVQSAKAKEKTSIKIVTVSQNKSKPKGKGKSTKAETSVLKNVPNKRQNALKNDKISLQLIQPSKYPSRVQELPADEDQKSQKTDKTLSPPKKQRKNPKFHFQTQKQVFKPQESPNSQKKIETKPKDKGEKSKSIKEKAPTKKQTQKIELQLKNTQPIQQRSKKKENQGRSKSIQSMAKNVEKKKPSPKKEKAPVKERKSKSVAKK